MTTMREMGLTVETVAGGCVVSDGEALWTCDAAALRAGLDSIDLASYEDDPDGLSVTAQTYASLCARVPYLARTEPERHETIVAAWRACHAPNMGNWS